MYNVHLQFLNKLWLKTVCTKYMSVTVRKVRDKVGSGDFKLPPFSLYKLRIFKASFALAKHLEACPY